jgi:hypothetical protein
VTFLVDRVIVCTRKDVSLKPAARRLAIWLVVYLDQCRSSIRTDNRLGDIQTVADFECETSIGWEESRLLRTIYCATGCEVGCNNTDGVWLDDGHLVREIVGRNRLPEVAL